jgi:hypothetical protein
MGKSVGREPVLRGRIDNFICLFIYIFFKYICHANMWCYKLTFVENIYTFVSRNKQRSYNILGS